MRSISRKACSTVRHELGLDADLGRDDDGWVLRVRTQRLATSVHVVDPHYRASEAWFHLAPGTDRVLRLVPLESADACPDGAVLALNGRAAARYRARP